MSTFPKSGYDLEELLTTLGIGEAVVTVLSERGAPTPVAWTRLRAPQSLMAPAPAEALAAAVAASPLQAEYGAAARPRVGVRAPAGEAAPPPRPRLPRRPRRTRPRPPRPPERQRQEREEPSAVAQVIDSPVVKSFLRSAGSALGREITRSLFGTARRR